MPGWHEIYVGKVVAAYSDMRAFNDGRFLPLGETPEALRTLHHLGAGNFVVPGSTIHAQILEPLKP